MGGCRGFALQVLHDLAILHSEAPHANGGRRVGEYKEAGLQLQVQLQNSRAEIDAAVMAVSDRDRYA